MANVAENPPQPLVVPASAGTQWLHPLPGRPVTRARRAGSERVDTGHFATDHELMHGFSAFVGDHGFQIERVTDRAMLGGDARAAEDVARFAGDIDGHAAI